MRPADHERTEAGRAALAVATVGALVALVGALVVVDARRARIDERPLVARLDHPAWEVDLAELVVLDDESSTVRIVLDVLELDDADRDDLADRLAEEVRRQLGADTRTRLVLRDVLTSG